MFIFSAVGPTAYCNTDNHDRSKAAFAARDIAIANINPDIVYVINFLRGIVIVILSPYLPIMCRGKRFVYVMI